MASTTTHASPEASLALGDSVLRPMWVALGAVALAFLFGIPDFVASVTATDHFGYAVLVPFAAAYLIWYRLPSLHGLAPGSAWLAFVGIVVSALLLFDSLLTNSSSNWALSLMLVVPSLVYLCGGFPLLGRTWTALVVLVLMIRPPFGLDLKLAQALQIWVSRQASSILDMLSVPHQLEGNVIHLINQPLHVEEACSGINSLFATAAVLVFAMLLLRRPVAHALALFGFGFVAVLAVNVFRVVALTWMHHYSARLGDFFDMWLPHMAFGMACFALLLLLLFSGDALLFLSIDRLWYVFPPPLMMRLGWLTGIESDRMDTSPEEDAIEASGPSLRETIPARQGAWRAVTGVFGVLAALQLVVVGLALIRGEAHAELPEGDPLAGQLANKLPAEWEGWKLVSFKEQQHMEFFEANYSSIWEFKRGDQVATIYLHRPYRDYHQLQACYLGTGWVVDDQAGGIDEPSGLQYALYSIDHDDRGLYALAFTFGDLANQQWLVPPITMQSRTGSQRLRNSLAFRVKAFKGLFQRRQRATVASAGLAVEMRTTRENIPADREAAVQMLSWAAGKLFPDFESTIR